MFTLRVKGTAEDLSRLIEDARQGKLAQVPVETPDGTRLMMTIGNVIIDRGRATEPPEGSWKVRHQIGNSTVTRDTDDTTSR